MIPTMTFYKVNSISDPGAEISADIAAKAFWAEHDLNDTDSWVPFERTATIWLMDTYGGWDPDVEQVHAFVSYMWAHREQVQS